jgi:hypothetical protein
MPAVELAWIEIAVLLLTEYRQRYNFQLRTRKKKFAYEATPEVSVIGIPLGAETAGSLIELSGRGSADAKPKERAVAMNGAIKTMMKGWG